MPTFNRTKSDKMYVIYGYLKKKNQIDQLIYPVRIFHSPSLWSLF